MAEATPAAAPAPAPLDAALLSGPLQPSPGLDAFDARGEEITALAIQGRYREAAGRAEALWRAGIYDVRPLGYYLYGFFAESAVAGLPALFATLASALGDNWDAFGPQAKKEEQTDRALLWLFKTLLKRVERHEQHHDASWQSWASAGEADALADACHQAEALPAALTRRLPQARCLDRFQHLQAWLTSQAALAAADKAAQAAAAGARVPAATSSPGAAVPMGVVAAPSPSAPRAGLTPSPPPTAPSEPASDLDAAGASHLDALDTDNDGDADLDGHPMAAFDMHETHYSNDADNDDVLASRADAARASAADAPVISVAVTAPLALLLRKMDAFAVLVQRRNFIKAAIIAADIQSVMAHFDPRVFLPSLFGDYARLASRHAAALARPLADAHGFAFEARAQLYQVDLDAFVHQPDDAGDDGASFVGDGDDHGHGFAGAPGGLDDLGFDDEAAAARPPRRGPAQTPRRRS